MTDTTELVTELVKKLTDASKVYYGPGSHDCKALKKLRKKAEGLGIRLPDDMMSDNEFDAAVEKLRELDPTNAFFDAVGAESPNNKIKHLRFMGSLNKFTEDVPGLQAWIAGREVVIEFKLDGATVELQYKDRELVLGVTRGDGEFGEDVTAAVRQMASVPKQLPACFPMGLLSIRGEVILTHKNWAIVDPTMRTNPRNVGTGILTRSDTSEARLLKFVAHDFGLTEGKAYDYFMLRPNPFEIPATVLLTDPSKLSDTIDSFAMARDGLEYDVDGIVIKLNDLAQREAAGMTSGRPKGQVAFKWSSVTAITTLTGVVLTTGHTGLISPTATLKPVKLDGVTVSNVLLCNSDEIERLNVAIGDEVEIIRRGELIPKVVRVISRPANRQPISIRSCPCCGGKVGKKPKANGEPGVNDFCLNEDCSGKSFGKLKRWLKCHKILGIGDGLLDELIETGMVATPADFYRISPSMLAELPMGNGVVGASRAASITKEIQNKRVLKLSTFIGSLGIPSIGRRKAQIMIERANGGLDTLTDWNSDNLAGIAEEVQIASAVDEVTGWFQSNQALLNDLLTVVTVQSVKEAAPEVEEQPVVEAAVDQQVFLLTGKFEVPKKDIHALITAKGHRFATEFTSEVTCLVQADASSTSSKTKKAVASGIPVISLDNLNANLK